MENGTLVIFGRFLYPMSVIGKTHGGDLVLQSFTGEQHIARLDEVKKVA